jgi:hypothetical protein
MLSSELAKTYYIMLLLFFIFLMKTTLLSNDDEYQQSFCCFFLFEGTWRTMEEIPTGMRLWSNSSSHRGGPKILTLGIQDCK